MSRLPRDYDAWRTHVPEEPEDPLCTCWGRKRDKFCPIHGIDPDEEREKRRERQWDKEIDKEWGP